MARAVFTNNARTTLSAGINNSVTSISVTDGSVLPSPTGGDYAYLTIEEGSTREIVQLTARSGNTLTVTRARDGTTGQTFTTSATVTLRLPKIVLDEIWTGIDGKQASNANLTALAGLTLVADRLPYANGSGTLALATFTAAGRALLDDADASAQLTTLGVSTFAKTILDDADAAAVRTTLGLGTAAVVNTGTSGGTIPLNNGANTWSSAQTFLGGVVSENAAPYFVARDSDAANGAAISSEFIIVQDSTGTRRFSLQMASSILYNNLVLDSSSFRWRIGTGFTEVMNLTSSGLTVLGNTVWHAGNDGAGSGLDADTVDGVQGSGFAQLASANTFTARQIIDRSAASAAGNLTLRGGGSGFTRSSITLETGDTARGAGTYIWDDTSDVEFFFGLRYQHSSADALSILRRTGVTSGSTDSATASAASATELVRFSSTGMTARVEASTETTGTLTAASANKTIQLTGNPTINNSVFAAGDIIVMYAGASARTITAGTITTMRLDGTATTGNRTIAARGVAILFFVSASEVVVAGGSVT